MSEPTRLKPRNTYEQLPRRPGCICTNRIRIDQDGNRFHQMTFRRECPVCGPEMPFTSEPFYYRAPTDSEHKKGIPPDKDGKNES